MADEFDLKAARESGYSNEEIAKHLMEKQGLDFDAAREHYKPEEIIQKFTGQEPIPEGKVTVTTSPVEAAEFAAPAYGVARYGVPAAVKPITATFKAAAQMLPQDLDKVRDPGSLQRYLNTQLGHKFNVPIEELEKLTGKQAGDIFSYRRIQDAIKNLEAQSPGWTDQFRGAPKTASVGQMLGEMKAAIPTIGGKILQKAMPIATAAGAAADLQDMINRYEHGDTMRGHIAAAGLLGSGVAALAPHPLVKYGGLGVSAAAPAINALIDKYYGREGYATGGPVNLASGGQPPKSDADEGQAFIGYPQINKNRKIGSGTGFLDALVGAPPSRTNILNPSDYSYQEGYEKGEPYGIAGMMLPFAGAAAKPLAREVATRAFMGESLTPRMMRGLMPEQAISRLTAYHGTPHNIEGNFDLAKVGTGEGAQVYGHGIYFAQKPGVARDYQKKLSDSELRLKGERLENQYDNLRKEYGDVAGTILQYAHDNGLSDAKNLIENYTRYPQNAKYFGDPIIDNASLADLQKAKAALNEVERHSLGNLYKVDIPDEHIPKMLDWDKPLSQQPHVWNALDQNVKDAIDEFLENRYVNSMSNALEAYTGKDLYKALKHHEIGEVLPAELPNSSWNTGNTTYEKHASAYLNSLDIPGIKYYDQGSRGNIPQIRRVDQEGKMVYEVNPGWNDPNQKKFFDTREEAQNYADSFGTRNFVSFRPEEVKILEKNSEPVGPLSSLE